MKSFSRALENTLNKANNLSITENGAVGLKTSGSALVDLNFATSSMRGMSELETSNLFSKAWDENPMLALKWVFFARDIREGMGERRSFREILKWIGNTNPQIAIQLISLKAEDEYVIPFFGRWDDILVLYPKFKKQVVSVIRSQLKKDRKNMELGKPVSLLAKWMPSVNTSNNETVKIAMSLARDLRLSPRNYRKTLSRLREYIDVVERKMSANKWSDIDYERVPSKANLIYSNAFLKHDHARRCAYLKNLSKGEAKINASTAYPYEIVKRIEDIIVGDWYYRSVSSRNLDNLTDEQLLQIASLEEMWKEIHKKKDSSSSSSTIVVCDGSGSMLARIPKSSATSLNVATSLSIYFSELLDGDFKDKFITFSKNPKLVDLSGYDSLAEKLIEVSKYDEVANTNIEAVFDLILETAMRNKDASVPENILIISDMEFDSCIETNSGRYIPDTLFETITQRYASHGYKLPRLIFWNVCSRTNTIPISENDNGVTLVSGFSPAIMDMVFDTKNLDPYIALKKVLMEERYSCLDKIDI